MMLRLRLVVVIVVSILVLIAHLLLYRVCSLCRSCVMLIAGASQLFLPVGFPLIDEDC